jgi:hypothetical protein
MTYIILEEHLKKTQMTNEIHERNTNEIITTQRNTNEINTNQRNANETYTNDSL